MPGLSGTAFLTRAKDMHPDCMRITLSGQADMAGVLGTINEDAVCKCLTKPWDDARLHAHVHEAFRVQATLSSTCPTHS